jgi:di/tricarboxylate transporter
MSEFSPQGVDVDFPWIDHCPCRSHDRNLAESKDASPGELWEIIFVSVVLFFMFAALLTEKVGADWVMITGLTLFMVTEIITIKEGLEGFANEGILTVLVLFVVAEGISRTGALDWYMAKLLGHPTTVAGAQIRLMVPIAILSAFLNNTPIVAVMIPITQRWAKTTGVPLQQLLMPLSFATILGGTCTLIGTSTNLVVSGLLKKNYPEDPRLSDIGTFDLGLYGVPVAIFGLTYILLAAPLLLPGGRSSDSGRDSLQGSDELFLGARLTPWSPAAGRTVKRSGLRDTGGIYLVSVHRAATGNMHRAISPDFVLSVGDVLYFTGLVESFGEFCDEHGLEVVTNEVNDTPELKGDAGPEDHEDVPPPTTDSVLHPLIDVPASPAWIPLDVSVTKDSIMHAEDAERLRSINHLTDQIRGQTLSDTDGGRFPTSPIAAHRTSAKKDGIDPPQVFVYTDAHVRDRIVIIGVDAQDRPGLLLDISKAFLRLNFHLRHTEARVLGERSVSIWRCECIGTELPDTDEVWSVLNALLASSNGTAAIKKRGLRVIRAVVTPFSRLIGKTALEMNFRTTYKAAIIALQKGGKNTSTINATLEAGDVLILQTGEDSPLLEKPPDDFYSELETSAQEPRTNSLANLVRFGSVQNIRGDLKATAKVEISGGEPDVDDIEHGTEDFEVRKAIDMGRGELSDLNAQNLSETTNAKEVAWKDLQVIWSSKGNGSTETGANQKEFLTAMEVAPNSPLENKTVAQLGISRLPGVYLVSIERPWGKIPDTTLRSRTNLVSVLRGLTVGGAESVAGESVDQHSILDNASVRYTGVSAEETLQVGDILWFSGSATAVGDLRRIPGLKSSQSDEVAKTSTNVHDRRLVQAVVARRGPLVGKTVKEVGFRTHYGAAVIAVHREGNRVHETPGNIKLHAGDVLLLEAGPTFKSKNSENDRAFALLAEVEDSAPPRLRVFALAVFLAVTMIAVPTIQGTSLLITSLVAAIIMVTCGVLTQQEARDAVKWDIFVTIGAAFGISSALTNSGVAAGLASFLVRIGKGVGIGGESMPVGRAHAQVELIMYLVSHICSKLFIDAGLYGAVYLATSLISSIITNNAAAALIFPIAMRAAEDADADMLIMAYTLMMAASDFMTPFGYTTNLMIYGPGGYTAKDFLLMGGPLQLLLWIVTTAILSTTLPWWISWLVTSALFIAAAASRLAGGRCAGSKP